MRLPDFVVIGAKKAGSTWLDRVLRSHSAVALPAQIVRGHRWLLLRSDCGSITYVLCF